MTIIFPGPQALNAAESSALYGAIVRHDSEEVREILKRRPAAARQQLRERPSEKPKGHYLACCIQAEFTHGIWLGLQHGLDLNTKIEFNEVAYTPLQLAVRRHLHDSLSFLIQHGANIAQSDADGNSLLVDAFSAAKGKTVELSSLASLRVVETLVENGTPWTAASAEKRFPVPSLARYITGHESCADKIVDIVEKGITRGWDINAVNHAEAATPSLYPYWCGLLGAVASDNKRLFVRLLEIGASAKTVENYLRGDNVEAAVRMTYAGWQPEMQSVLMRRQLASVTTASTLAAAPRRNRPAVL